jgi:hypothetical protein
LRLTSSPARARARARDRDRARARARVRAGSGWQLGLGLGPGLLLSSVRTLRCLVDLARLLAHAAQADRGAPLAEARRP